MGQERLIKATIAHSLEWVETEEGSVDRVTAIGFSARNNEVGDAMLRVDALDAVALRKVIFLIVRRLNHRHRMDRGYAQRLAIAVLHEFMRPNCIYCGGKGETHQKGAVVTICSHCNGSGLHRYSDSDRMALVRGAGSQFNHRAYEDALTYVRDAVRGIVVASDRRLDEQ
jgi:hypothetical protein